MAEYPINKGIGRPVEFKGLKAQYLFIFCGGLLALFILFVILYMVGIDQWVCIGFGVASSSVLVWQTFALNARYGEHGLMKLGAARSHPRYLINRRRITRLFKRQRKEETKYSSYNRAKCKTIYSTKYSSKCRAIYSTKYFTKPKCNTWQQWRRFIIKWRYNTCIFRSKGY